MPDDFNVSPNEMFGFIMRQKTKENILKTFKGEGDNYIIACLKFQREVIDEIIFELEQKERK